MERFFRRMPVDKPVIRNNYFVQMVKGRKSVESVVEDGEEGCGEVDIDPEELGWSTTSNGPEDGFIDGDGHGAGRRVVATPSTPSTLRLRTERQTLRRLPRSGAVVFTIRTYIVGVEELGRERGVPGRMASAVRGWPREVGEYKGAGRYREVLVGYLEGCEREQVRRGEVGDGEKVGEYPF